MALCGKSGESWLGILGCAGVEPGVVVAQSYGLPDNGSRLSPALDFTVGARVAIKLGAGLSVLAGGDLLVPAVRSQFEATDALGKPSVIFQRNWLGGSASLGIAVNIFP